MNPAKFVNNLNNKYGSTKHSYKKYEIELEEKKKKKNIKKKKKRVNFF